LLLPGVGSDAHMGKDWAFIGVAFRASHCQYPIWKTWLAYAIGIMSMVAHYTPLSVLLISDDTATAESYIASHWPIIMARDKMPAAMDTLSVEAVLLRAIPQTTDAKALVAFYNELPQGSLILIFGLAFGFDGFIIVSIILSLVKAFGIPIVRRAIASVIANSSQPNALVSFIQAHGDKEHFGGWYGLDVAIANDGAESAIPMLMFWEANTNRRIPPSRLPAIVAVINTYSQETLSTLLEKYPSHDPLTDLGVVMELAKFNRMMELSKFETKVIANLIGLLQSYDGLEALHAAYDSEASSVGEIVFLSYVEQKGISAERVQRSWRTAEKLGSHVLREMAVYYPKSKNHNGRFFHLGDLIPIAISCLEPVYGEEADYYNTLGF